MKKLRMVLAVGCAFLLVCLTPMSNAATNKAAPKSPTIIIYHTHNTEAYKPVGAYSYENDGTFHTNDDTKNINVIGQELARVLEEDYGYEVLHVVADHTEDSIQKAYQESRKTLEAYKAKYPSIRIAIDLHREIPKEDDAVTIGDVRLAKCLLVAGKGPEDNPNPQFDANQAWGKALVSYLQKSDAGLASLKIGGGTYNQNLFEKSLLIEAGDYGNTMEEARATVPYIAEAIDSTLR